MPNLDRLDDKNTVFGHVSEGMDTLLKINDAYCDTEGVPYQAIRLLRAVILEDPFDDPPGLEVPEAPPVREIPDIMKNRLRDDEDIDAGPPDDTTADELEKIKAEAEAKSRAEVSFCLSRYLLITCLRIQLFYYFYFSTLMLINAFMCRCLR